MTTEEPGASNPAESTARTRDGLRDDVGVGVGDGDGDSRREGRAHVREGVAFCARVFLVARLAMFVLAILAVALLPHAEDLPAGSLAAPEPVAVPAPLGVPEPVGVPGWSAHGITPGWHNLFTSFERFDALWFLRIAEQGYRESDGSAAFFPLYPIAIRVLAWPLGDRPLAASLIVSNVALFSAMCVLYFLTSSELSERHARTSILYLAVFPTAFFLFAPYGESLFLLLSILAFWGARRRRWAVAGAAGALAALTRSVGLLLVPALLVEAIHQWREEGGRLGGLAPRLVAALAPALGTITYLSYWASRTGDALAPLDVQQGWQRAVAFPIGTLWSGTLEAFRFPGVYPGAYHLVDWLITVPMLVAALYAVVRLRPAFSVYLWLSLLVPLSYVFEPRPLMSLPRFSLVMFPALWAVADATERGWVPRAAVVGASAAALGVLTTLFVNWYYIF